MSDYMAMQLGSINGILASEQAQRRLDEMIAWRNRNQNSQPQVDPASFYDLINQYNALVEDFNRQSKLVDEQRRDRLQLEAVIARKDYEIEKLKLDLMDEGIKLHETEFKLQREEQAGAGFVETIGKFLKAYRHYRRLLGIKRGDPYDVPGYW
jgi:phosphoenolpyruvate carboxylase